MIPEFGIYIVIGKGKKKQLKFIKDTDLISSVTFPVCYQDEVYDYFTKLNHNISNLLNDIEVLKLFLLQSDVMIFNIELHGMLIELSNLMRITKTVFKKRVVTKYDVTLYNNIYKQKDFELNQMIDRIAIFIRTNYNSN